MNVKYYLQKNIQVITRGLLSKKRNSIREPTPRKKFTPPLSPALCKIFASRMWENFISHFTCNPPPIVL